VGKWDKYTKICTAGKPGGALLSVEYVQCASKPGRRLDTPCARLIKYARQWVTSSGRACLCLSLTSPWAECCEGSAGEVWMPGRWSNARDPARPKWRGMRAKCCNCRETGVSCTKRCKKSGCGKVEGRRELATAIDRQIGHGIIREPKIGDREQTPPAHQQRWPKG